MYRLQQHTCSGANLLDALSCARRRQRITSAVECQAAALSYRLRMLKPEFASCVQRMRAGMQAMQTMLEERAALLVQLDSLLTTEQRRTDGCESVQRATQSLLVSTAEFRVSADERLRQL